MFTKNGICLSGDDMNLLPDFIRGMFEKRTTLKVPDNHLKEWLGGNPTATGVKVNATTATQCAAVFACVRVIAETVASLPFPVYKRTGSTKERDMKHPLYEILHDAPNSEQSSFSFWEMALAHMLLHGNHYSEIERDSAGRVVALWPENPTEIKAERDDNDEIVYIRRHITPIRAENMLHIPAIQMGTALEGISPIAKVREAIGLSLATEEYAGRFFGNNASPGGVIEYPGKLTEEANERQRKRWESAHKGLSTAHRVAILEEGMQFKPIGIPARDAQFIEVRKFQVNEIARIFRVPPHMIGDLERATFSNVEQQSIDFVVHTIRPWLVRIEKAVNRQLFMPQERATYFAEFLVDGLLRGDIKARYDAYAVGRQNGWLSADDIREIENMNPLPDGKGQDYWMPANMMIAGQQLPSDTGDET